MNITTTKENQIILMNSEQLKELIQKIHEVKELLQQKSLKDDLPELFRTSDVKKMLKIGESSLAGLRSNGTIPFTKIGGSIYYFKKDLEKIINDNYTGTHGK
jgi:hypothetical protein